MPFSASFPAPFVRKQRLFIDLVHSWRNEKILGYQPLPYYGIKPHIFTKESKNLKKLTSGAIFGAIFVARAPVEHPKSISYATPQLHMTSASLSIAFKPSIWWKSCFKHENSSFGVISGLLTPVARRKIDISSILIIRPPQWVSLRW